jgi:hypothetical protein
MGSIPITGFLAVSRKHHSDTLSVIPGSTPGLPLPNHQKLRDTFGCDFCSGWMMSGYLTENEVAL